MSDDQTYHPSGTESSSPSPPKDKVKVKSNKKPAPKSKKVGEGAGSSTSATTTTKRPVTGSKVNVNVKKGASGTEGQGQSRRGGGAQTHPTRPMVQPICLSDDDDEETDDLGSGGQQGHEGQQGRGRGGFMMEVEDDDSSGDGINISEMLKDLGSQLQTRIKAKRRRIQECFSSVKQCPSEMVEVLQNHSLERAKIIQRFQEKSNAIVKQVDGVLEMQRQTEEKLNIMMLQTQKHFNSMKDSLNGCVTGLKDIVSQFNQETSQLQGKHDQDAKNQLDKINQELVALQKKILRDGNKEEAECIRNTLKLK